MMGVSFALPCVLSNCFVSLLSFFLRVYATNERAPVVKGYLKRNKTRVGLKTKKIAHSYSHPHSGIFWLFSQYYYNTGIGCVSSSHSSSSGCSHAITLFSNEGEKWQARHVTHLKLSHTHTHTHARTRTHTRTRTRTHTHTLMFTLVTAI